MSESDWSAVPRFQQTMASYSSTVTIPYVRILQQEEIKPFEPEYKVCEYCKTKTEKESGSCEKCGAPL